MRDADSGRWSDTPQPVEISSYGLEYDDGISAADLGHFLLDAGFEHFFTGHAGLLGTSGTRIVTAEHPAEQEFLSAMARPENLRGYYERTRENIQRLLRWASAAQAALPYVRGARCVGIGTGTTVNFFIAELAAQRGLIRAAVSSSNATSTRLRAAGIDIIDLNDAGPVDVYVDGADEATRQRQLIKGGGGALTREKILAAVAQRFVCVVDEGKVVQVLGSFPLPVEVIAMARSYVAAELKDIGGRAIERSGFVTDNGNIILDVHDLQIDDPVALERRINDIAGVVTVGLFAVRRADVLLIGSAQGVETL